MHILLLLCKNDSCDSKLLLYTWISSAWRYVRARRRRLYYVRRPWTHNTRAGAAAGEDVEDSTCVSGVLHVHNIYTFMSTYICTYNYNHNLLHSRRRRSRPVFRPTNRVLRAPVVCSTHIVLHYLPVHINIIYNI